MSRSSQDKFSLLVEFVRKNGRSPKSREIYKGEKIGYYFCNVKYGKHKITFEQKELLKSLGVKFETRKDKYENLSALIKFAIKKNRAPKFNEEFEGKKIGVFLNNVKTGNTGLSNEMKMLLKEFNIYIDEKSIDKVHKKVLLLIDFYNLYGRYPVQCENDFEGVNIANFFFNVKYGYTKISDEDYNLLTSSCKYFEIKRR